MINKIADGIGEQRTDVLLMLLDNMVWPILVVSFLVFGVLLPQLFFSFTNVKFIIYSSAALGVLALAESVCLLSGNFDLSVAAIAGFTAMFSALFIHSWFPGMPGIVGIAVALALGAFIGLLNGVSVGILGVNPFLQTLTFYIIFGEATSVLSSLSIANLPASYLFLGGGTVSGVPVAVLVLLVLFVGAWWFFDNTRTGLAVYSVGGDEQASAEAGIDTSRIIVLVYVVSGLLSGLAGLMYAGYIGTAAPTLANGALFPAFAAAVIGGISLFGGRGNILGALGGVLLLSIIQSGLVLLSVPATWVRVVNGLILLAAVLLYTGEERLRRRLLTV